jgi:anti-anti-sigma regulatory factor
MAPPRRHRLSIDAPAEGLARPQSRHRTAYRLEWMQQKIAIEWPNDGRDPVDRMLLGDRIAEHFVAGYDLIVAFTHCRWIDAAVMDMLVTAHTVARERGRRIVLCELGDYLAEHFAVTAFDQILPVANTIEAARVLLSDPPDPDEG